MDHFDHLLIGGGMAAASCAAELRRKGAEGSIAVVTREPEVPYERPPLSKEYLRGEAERSAAYVNATDWYGENGVELLTKTSVTELDPAARTAKFHGHDEITFGTALLATGANVNILHVDGAELDGIHYLRTFANSDSIRDDAADAEHIVLIGGSYIACEVAASLTALGKNCTLVAQEQVALSRTFGDEAGSWFHEVLTGKGIEFAGGESLGSFAGNGRVEVVRTESGREFEADMVVVGAGVHPDVMLAKRAGLEIGDGITCDARLATSAEGIFAAGDCCSYDSVIHDRRLRVEHWDVAMQQGRHAARAMLGDREPYRVVPYFFSDLADWASLEYVGPAIDWDQVVWRGSREDGEFSVWYLGGGRVLGALSVERSPDLQTARRLIETGADVSGRIDELADPGSDLDSIV